MVQNGEMSITALQPRNSMERFFLLSFGGNPDSGLERMRPQVLHWSEDMGLQWQKQEEEVILDSFLFASSWVVWLTVAQCRVFCQVSQVTGKIWKGTEDNNKEPATVPSV